MHKVFASDAKTYLFGPKVVFVNLLSGRSVWTLSACAERLKHKLVRKVRIWHLNETIWKWVEISHKNVAAGDDDDAHSHAAFHIQSDCLCWNWDTWAQHIERFVQHLKHIAVI